MGGFKKWEVCACRAVTHCLRRVLLKEGCVARRAAPARAPMSEVLTPSQKKREQKLRAAKAKGVAELQLQQAQPDAAQLRTSARVKAAKLNRAEEAAAEVDSDADDVSDHSEDSAIEDPYREPTFAQYQTAYLQYMRTCFGAIQHAAHAGVFHRRLMKKLGVTAPSPPAPPTPAKPKPALPKSKPRPSARAATIIQAPMVDVDQLDVWETFKSWLADNSLSALEKHLEEADITSLEAARTFKGKDKILREELERHSSGKKIPMHLIIQLQAALAHKKGSSEARLVLEAEDLVSAVLEQGKTPPSLVPRVDALLSKILSSEHALGVRQCLQLAGIAALEGSDASTEEMNAEALEEFLDEAGASPPSLIGSSSELRDVRQRFKMVVKSVKSSHVAPAHTASAAAEAPSMVTGADRPDLEMLLQNMQGQDNKPLSLEDEAGYERLGNLCRNSAASAVAMDLAAVCKSGDDSQIAEAVLLQSAALPDLAAVLHHENLKVPTGVQPLNPPGVVRVELGRAREVAKACLRVQKVAPAAISRAKIQPNVPQRLSSSACEELMQQVWFGHLLSKDSGGSFDLGKILESKQLKSLVGGAKSASSDQSSDWMMTVWPALVICFETAHQIDRTASSIISRVGNYAHGNASSATLAEGLQEVVVPFLRELSVAWGHFQRGGIYPSCSKVWEKTARDGTSVAAWIQSSSLRSRQSTQIVELQGKVKELETLLSKVLVRVDKMEKRPTPRQPGAHQPATSEVLKEGDDGFTPVISRKDRRAQENREFHAEKARQAEATKATAQAAPPSTEEPAATTGQKTVQRNITHVTK